MWRIQMKELSPTPSSRTHGARDLAVEGARHGEEAPGRGTEAPTRGVAGPGNVTGREGP